MNSGRFFIPSIGMMRPYNLGSYPMMGTSVFSPKTGIFNKIIASIKGVNWGGIVNGANKTLNVVNQTIPLIKQTKPMISNMRDMMRLAKTFNKETSNKLINKNNLTTTKISNNEKKKEVMTNSPNFFI